MAESHIFHVRLGEEGGVFRAHWENFAVDRHIVEGLESNEGRAGDGLRLPVVYGSVTTGSILDEFRQDLADGQV